jgi:hypothetical protein
MPQQRVTDPFSGETRTVEVGPVNQLTFSTGPTISQADIDLGKLQQPIPSHAPDAPLSPDLAARARDLRQQMRAPTTSESINNALAPLYENLASGVMQSPLVGPALRMQGIDPAGMLEATGDQVTAAPIPVQPIKGFYSRLDQDLLNAVKSPSHPNRIKSLLRNVASQEEADYRGLNQWLTSKGNQTVSPQELKAFLDANPHGVSETVLGGRSVSDVDREIDDLMHEHNGDMFTDDSVSAAYARLMEERTALDSGKGAPRWDREDVNLPGGERYREYVFTLPTKKAPLSQPEDLFAKGFRAVETEHNPYTDQRTVRLYGPPSSDRHAPPFIGERSGTRLTPEQVLDEYALQLAESKSKAAEKSLNYTSGHWSGITNPVAHLRMDDRVTVNGEKAALIQEGQSDWHQQGREQGYRSTSSDAEVARIRREEERLENLRNRARDELVEALDEATKHSMEMGLRRAFQGPSAQPWQAENLAKNILSGAADDSPLRKPAEKYLLAHAEWVNASNARTRATQGGIPDAPFKDTGWQKLTFNRAVVDAVDQDKDWVLWTTGDQQAERYGNLLKDVQLVEWDPHYEQLVVYTKDRTPHTFDDVKTEKDVEGYIGKNATQRLLAHGREHGTRTYENGVPQETYSLDTSNEPMKITSAGMVQQYDTNWVNHATKLGKPYGATVEKVKTRIPPDHLRYSVYQSRDGWRVFEQATQNDVGPPHMSKDAASDAAMELNRSDPRDHHDVWGLRLTPQLKQAVKEKGLPLLGLSGLSLLASHDRD